MPMSNLKKIYDLLPFKKQFFTGVKYFVTPPKRITQHLHFKAKIKIKTENNFFVMQHYGYIIENELFWHGIENAWERTSFKLWKRFCAEANVIFDIGANTGVYSLIAGSVNSKAKIYAFEPVKSVYEKLNKNIELNAFRNNVKTFETALSDYTGEAIIYLEKNAEHVLSVTVNKTFMGDDVEQRTEVIKTIRLDEFIENEKIESIDLMKIDVETHEPEVLEGMGIYLSRFRPVILIEILNDEIGARVQHIIQGLNYRFYNIDEKTDTITEVKSITRSSFFNYLLCPEEIKKKVF